MKTTAIFALACAMMGCSGHTETATESKTAAIATQNDDLSLWIAEMKSNSSVLAQLNDSEKESDAAAHFASWCADKDVQNAVKSLHYAPISEGASQKIGLEILRNIPNSGSEYRAPHLARIEELEAQMAGAEVSQAFSWASQDDEILEKSLKAAGFSTKAADAEQTFVELLKGDSCQKILPRYCEFARQASSQHEKERLQKAELDAYLACDLTSWAGELRLNYPQNDYKFDRFRKYINDDSIVSVRKQVFVQDMAKRGVSKAFDSIEPPDPQYKLLLNSRKIYQDAIEAGGWPVIHASDVKNEPVLGKTYDYVPELRARLNAEGYKVGDTTNAVFDQNLADAIALYRDVHQLSNKKIVDKTLFKNLAVPPEDRLETIDLALQKYRESAIGSLQYYVKVNVPDFHVEVWRDGKREARNRIVVGNDKVQLDPVTQKQVPDPETLYPLHPNRTPLQTSKINEIILNPYWNVPERIRIEELEPKLAENPNYYLENNYEEVNPEDPKLYYVRELPNPKNSLGQVKFMFPNPHNTYLHDTPAKAVFKNPVRAYSHGCMRVQNPLDLAELLLKNDGQWESVNVDQILHADPLEQVTIGLKHPVDVDVVYIDARVDDSGVVAFLSDVYDYDAVRTGKIVLKKLPKPKVLK